MVRCDPLWHILKSPLPASGLSVGVRARSELPTIALVYGFDGRGPEGTPVDHQGPRPRGPPPTPRGGWDEHLSGCAGMGRVLVSELAVCESTSQFYSVGPADPRNDFEPDILFFEIQKRVWFNMLFAVWRLIFLPSVPVVSLVQPIFHLLINICLCQEFNKQSNTHLQNQTRFFGPSCQAQRLFGTFIDLLAHFFMRTNHLHFIIHSYPKLHC